MTTPMADRDAHAKVLEMHADFLSRMPKYETDALLAAACRAGAQALRAGEEEQDRSAAFEALNRLRVPESFSREMRDGWEVAKIQIEAILQD